MYDRILVPTDGSDGTGRVVDRAVDVARTFGASLHVLYVVDTRPYDGVDLVEEGALERAAIEAGRRALADLDERASRSGLEVSRATRTGVPDAEIVAYADDNDVDLVVMGTHGRTGVELAALGSTTERVLRGAAVPVVTVRLAGGPVGGDPSAGAADERGPTVAGYDDVLVPTDGSDPAGRAAEHAVTLAERAGATVHALYVVDASIFEYEDAPRSILGTLRQGGRNAASAVESLAADASVPSTATVAEGNPTEEILAAAEEVEADLVALGRRGRTGRPDVLLGSTTARVVRLAESPVLSVP